MIKRHEFNKRKNKNQINILKKVLIRASERNSVVVGSNPTQAYIYIWLNIVKN